MKWPEISIKTPAGVKRGIAPSIISASRSTDLPAFHSDWFLHRLKEGYVKWVNPFNQRPQYISFENTQLIVFWSKNPAPMISRLQEVDSYGYGSYFQFTLNDYERENFEPRLPPLRERIDTFQELSKRCGVERVIWRFDPLMLTPTLGVDGLMEKIARVGEQIAPFTQKLVFSFADLSGYRRVQNNLRRKGIEWIEFSGDQMVEVAERLAAWCKTWGIVAATCGESVDLSQWDIEHNRCIDDELILKLCGRNPALRWLFGGDDWDSQDLFLATNPRTAKKMKDPGQRAACGCVCSKDIGQYNTCPHLCAYCYANSSESEVQRRMARVSLRSETIV